jgi:hypothetical protein
MMTHDSDRSSLRDRAIWEKRDKTPRNDAEVRVLVLHRYARASNRSYIA